MVRSSAHLACPVTCYAAIAARSCILPQRGRKDRRPGGSQFSKKMLRDAAMTKNLERSYDGIIIGAGHHGLVLGSYLAKAGLDILLVDRRLAYGGGLNTTEATAPGFYHNLHSINHFHISETPWFRDLGLASRVTYITPR